MGKKGENVYTGVDDGEYLSKGILQYLSEKKLKIFSGRSFNDV
jgi:fumarate hydratase class I